MKFKKNLMPKRVLCLIFAIMMAASVMISLPITVGAATANTWDIDGDGELEILGIGNSFTNDTLRYVYHIAKSLGVKKVSIAFLYQSSASLEDHCSNVNSDAIYTYYYCSDSTGGVWKTATSNYTAQKALKGRTWDYVMLQQNSNNYGSLESYDPYLNDLISYVKQTAVGSPKIVWNMIWADQKDSTRATFEQYDYDQEKMYNAFMSATQSIIVSHEDIDIILPTGTAIQNARTSMIGDTVTRDGYHLNYLIGRTIASLLVVKAITGFDISKSTYRTTSSDVTLSEFEHIMAVDAVNKAMETPYSVTKSAYSPEDYVLFKPEMTIGAYWCSNNGGGNHNVLISNEPSISPYFAATARLTKQDLPVGSFIVMDSEWLNRPEGWVTDTKQDSRPDQTSATFVEITEEWWGDYTLRAFNIKHNPSKKLTGYTADDIYEVFQIYVPKAIPAHEHEYQHKVCVVCGASQTVKITAQPTDSEAVLGNKISVQMCVEGEGLTYTWYYKDINSSRFYCSTITADNYTVNATAERNGRQVYCVITDKFGNKATTDTVTLNIVPEETLEIVSQPTYTSAVYGEWISVRMDVNGDDLTYAWYYKDVNLSRFYLSTITADNYTIKATAERNGRQVYCVITDAFGNQVTTDVVTINIASKETLEIISQPSYETAVLGEKVSLQMNVKGDALTYTWYYKDTKDSKFYKSTITEDNYTVQATAARNGRQVYCVITDALGNQVTTDVVTINVTPKETLEIISQPSYAAVKLGNKVSVQMDVKGDDLAYTWYYKDTKDNKFYKSSITADNYAIQATAARNGRQVYCVITDALGNQVTTDMVVLVFN